MSKMTASISKPIHEKEMTPGQIDKFVDLCRTIAEKHSREFSSKSVQNALSRSDLAEKMFEVFRSEVELFSTILVRDVLVKPRNSALAALRAAGVRLWRDEGVVAALPKPKRLREEVIFFQVETLRFNGTISNRDLQAEYQVRGLKPAPLTSLAAVCENDDKFAYRHSCATQWVDDGGAWCYAVVSHDGGKEKPNLSIGKSDERRDSPLWFAGVRDEESQ